MPTNWAGTPDALHLVHYKCFAKCLFAKLPVKISTWRSHQCVAPVPKRLGISTFPPRPRGEGNRQAIIVGPFSPGGLAFWPATRKAFDFPAHFVLEKQTLPAPRLHDARLLDAKLNRPAFGTLH